MPRIDPLAGGAGVTRYAGEDEFETPALPREHPRWVTDVLAVSSRARAVLARMRPAVVRVLSFWDHRVRSLRIGARRLSVDPSGSYRLD